MRKDDLAKHEATLMKEVVRRRALGGYSMEAEGVLILTETLLRVVQHMLETYPEQGDDSNEDAPRSPRNGRGGSKGNNRVAK